jgi:hypothetical protein
MLSMIAACSDMNPDDDTYNVTILGLAPGGSGGDGQMGNAGSGGRAGTGGTEGDPPGGMSLLDTPAWSCLKPGAPSVMTPRTGAPARVTYRVLIVDFDSQTPIPGLIVQGCTTSNCDVYPECTTPTPGPTEACAIVKPPTGATYEIEFPYQFQGGLKLTKPGEYAEMDYFFGGPLVGLPEAGLDNGGNVVYGLGIPVLKTSTRLRAYNEVGAATVDADRGTLAVRTLNCLRQPAVPPATPPPPQGQRAAGVALEALGMAPEGALSWTLSNGNVFTKNRLVTDARGVAGFLQAPPEIVDVKAVLADGTEFGATSLRVRADVITLAELRPGLEVWGQ